MDQDAAVTAFGALATPSRVDILRLLATQAPPEGLKSGEIARRLNVQQNTLSTQLMMLSHARLVLHRREGRSIFYRLDRENLRALADFILVDCGGGSVEAKRRRAA